MWASKLNVFVFGKEYHLRLPDVDFEYDFYVGIVLTRRYKINNN